MNEHTERVARLDWKTIEAELDGEGYALLENFLSKGDVHELRAAMRPAMGAHRVALGAQDLGRGDLFYFSPALPARLEALREAFYRWLAPIANRWNRSVDIAYRFPDSLEAFLAQNRNAGQLQPQSSLSHLQGDGYQALHQRSDGERVFPLQLVGLLSEPGNEFTGGEFVMTEQRPRMQSRPMVLPLRQGDLAIITVARRPFKGTTGFYRVNLKHAISRVRSGERYGLELLLHDAR